MNWYVIYSNQKSNKQLLDFLNRYDDMEAFEPKIEKWFKCSHFKEYQITDMYPGYIFVKSPLNEDMFKEKYGELLDAVEGLGKVIEKDGFIVLRDEEKECLSLFFNNNGVITHSLGRYKGDDLLITDGPLRGLENTIKKINRHKRIAKVDYHLLGMNMVLPLEVMNSKGSES